MHYDYLENYVKEYHIEKILKQHMGSVVMGESSYDHGSYLE